MAAVARDEWIALFSWLPVRTFALDCMFEAAVRTNILGCRGTLADVFAIAEWVAFGSWLPVRTRFGGCRLTLAVSQAFKGLQLSFGCVRTAIKGCNDAMAIRSLSGGCKDYMAAFALIPWVADHLWLRSQSFHGLHLHNGLRSHFSIGLHCLCGCRVRTTALGCT